MPRVPRGQQHPASACYHVMNRGHNREVVFQDDDDRAFFLHLLARYHKRFELRIYHYCLMSNHFHVVLQLDRPKELSCCIAGLLRAYVHHFHRRYGFVGHLWQGRFKSPGIEAESYLLSCGRYVERNPLEAGLVIEPWDYRWSSCRAYAVAMTDSLLADNPWYQELGSTAAARQRRWREFLMGEDPREEVIRRGDWVLGEEGFRGRMHRPQARALPRRRGRPRQPVGAKAGFFPEFQ